MLALFEEEEEYEDSDVETDSDGPDEIFELFQLIYLQIDREKDFLEKENSIMQRHTLCVQHFQCISQIVFDFQYNIQFAKIEFCLDKPTRLRY